MPEKTSTRAVASTIIEGVYTVPLTIYTDDRGRFMESFRQEWFPWTNWDQVQSNRSDSHAGVLRGLHYHFEQSDYWYVPRGKIRAGLVDLRPSSPTFKAAQMIDVDAEAPIGLLIPPGVAHGFLALTDCTLIYIVNNYYNSGADEHGVSWADPDFGLEWGVDDPLLSDRDRDNPLFADIPAEDKPH